MLDLTVSKTSPTPIYEQIASQIEAMIVEGKLRAGDRLPSIRSLANGLDVSVITTKRAYADLEQAGLIESVQGRGCFVSESSTDAVQQKRSTKAAEAMGEAVRVAASAGMGEGEMRELFEYALAHLGK